MWQEIAMNRCKGTPIVLGVGLVGVVHHPPSALLSSLLHHVQQNTAIFSPSPISHECQQIPEK